MTTTANSNNPKLTHLLKNGIIANPRVKALLDTQQSSTTSTTTTKQATNNNNNNTQLQQQQSKNNVTLKVDIMSIMQAFGDSSQPLDESVNLMENILRMELKGFLYLCDCAADITGSKTLTLKEAIYTMRNEKNRLLRLFKYFGRLL